MNTASISIDSRPDGAIQNQVGDKSIGLAVGVIGNPPDREKFDVFVIIKRGQIIFPTVQIMFRQACSF